MKPLPHGIYSVAPEVLYTDRSFVSVDASVVSLLKSIAIDTPRKRCRLCAHPDANAAQQEMLIVMHQQTYVRPHRHFGKTETCTVFEGAADALVFNERGDVTDLLTMTAFGEGGSFFYRMPERVFHTLIFRTEWLVYLETTAGPFDLAKSEGAVWAPPETEPAAGHAYLKGLRLP
jgi:cupin fold WbuC family metalloprotein